MSTQPEKKRKLEKRYNFRSDTVTMPTESMKQVMREGIEYWGDDCHGDDPIVKELEQKAADMLGKEAGLLVCSGTMGNLVCVMAHCDVRGSEFICGSSCHIVEYEQGACATVAGAMPRTVPNLEDGTMDLALMEQAIRGDSESYPITRMIALENTHCHSGGKVVPLSFMDGAVELAKKNGIAVHLDGARIFNAAAALQVPASRVARGCDSVMFCLSKGLCAPFGSVVCGSKAFIKRARRVRKSVGGALHQAGMLAAMGLVALWEMPQVLAADNHHAKQLALALNQVEGLTAHNPQSNILYVDTMGGLDAKEVEKELEARNVLVFSMGKKRLRFCMHPNITKDCVEYAAKETVEGVKKLLTGNL